MRLHFLEHKIYCRECQNSIRFDLDLESKPKNVIVDGGVCTQQNFSDYNRKNDQITFELDITCSHCGSISLVKGHADNSPIYRNCDECGYEHHIECINPEIKFDVELIECGVLNSVLETLQ